MSSIQSLDFAIIGFLNSFAGRSDLLDRLIFDVADSSVLQGGVFMAIFWWYWFRPSRDMESVRREILIAFFGGLAAVLVSRVLQLSLPFHLRPLHTPELGFVPPFGVDPETMSDWNSFPSDHAVLFFALATAIWYQSWRMGLAAMAWSLLVVCLPRIYLGYHYPSDVLAGAVVGVALMALAHRVLDRSPIVDRVIDWAAHRRAAFYCIAFVTTFELGVMFYDVRHLARDGIGIAEAIAGAPARAASVSRPFAPVVTVNAAECAAPSEHRDSQ